MSWRKMFSKGVLKQAEEYYRAGKAKKLTRDEDPDDFEADIFSATVRGSRNYHVEIYAYAGEVTGMSCTCDEAREGLNCKHMAATLMVIEDEYGSLEAMEDWDDEEDDEDVSLQNDLHQDQKTDSFKEGNSRQSGPEKTSDSGKTAGSGKAAAKKKTNADQELVSWHPSSLPELDALQKAEAAQRKEEESNGSDGAGANYQPGEYRYFHPENFERGLNLSVSMRKDAERIIRKYEKENSSGKDSASRGYGYSRSTTVDLMQNFEAHIGYMQGNDTAPMVAQASATFSAYYGYGRFYARVTVGQDRVIDASCNSWECTHRNDKKSYLGYDLCVHEAALLLELEAYLNKNNVGDATSTNARDFLAELIPQSVSGESAEGESDETDGKDAEKNGAVSKKILTIQPHAELSDGFLSTTFYVGSSKPYKIKSIPEFVDAMRKQETTTFGTSTRLPLGENNLKDERSHDWYEFMVGALKERDQQAAYYDGSDDGYWPQIVIKANIPLYGSRLDEFADLAEGETFELWDKAYPASMGKKMVQIRDANPEVHLEIHAAASNGGKSMDGVRITGEIPSFIEGQNCLYYVTDHHLNRVTKEKAREISPLVRIAKDGEIDIRIGRARLADFYHKALPALKKIANVTEYDTDIINRYIPPEPTFVAYFDTENQSVLCRLEVSYGPQIFSPADVAELPYSQKDGRVYGSLKPSYRDTGAEFQYFVTAFQYLPNYDDELKVLFCQKNDEQVFDLLDHGLAELMNYGEVRMTQRFQSLGIRRHVRFNVGVTMESNLMDLSISAENLTEDEMYQILYQYQRKRKFVKLKDGTFLKLDNNETVQDLLQIMETMHVPLKEFVKGKMKLPAYRALYLDKMLETTEDLYANRDRRFKQLIKEFKTVEDADYDIPKGLEKTLRNYQKEGYRWLRTLDQYGFGGILADEMGLGKTLQVIAVLLAVKQEMSLRIDSSGDPLLIEEQVPAGQACLPGDTSCNMRDSGKAAGQKSGKGKILPVVQNTSLAAATDAAAETEEHFKTDGPMTSLIVCPASLVYNWEEEIHRFAPELTVAAAAGAAGERKKIIRQYQDYDVLVTSYDLLKRDIAEYEGLSFRFEVVDEAQYIKNHTTAVAKTVKLIRAQTRYALTGTPIENRLSELWSIFDYLMPGFLYGYDEFRASIELPVANDDENAKERLRRMVAPFILRRRKADVLKDLPEKLEEVRYVAMGKKQQELYDAQVMKMKADLEDQSDVDFRKGKIEILAQLTRIRQLCCDPLLVYTNYDGGSAKREALTDMIQSLIEEGHRALVFSQFTSMLELIEKDLQREKIRYYKITGSTPKEKRVELVREFNENKEKDSPDGPVSIFLISLKAGGTGLNLTGADVVIHYDPWWNTAAEDQATDRAHRIGQKKVVTVYKLIIRNSIEDRILELQERKKDLADQVLGGEGIGSSNITREDLMQILE